MMRHFYIIFAVLLITACDDGDIITVDLEFNEDLELCTTAEDAFLIYSVKEEPSESLTLIIPRNSGANVPFTEPNFPDINTPPSTYPIGGASSPVRFIYRKYNRTLGSNELCEIIPPGDLDIINNSESSDGDVYVTVIVEDDDLDDIPSELEGRGEMDEEGNYPDAIDTDGDGIPNYQDEDDDGDNVLTKFEIIVDDIDNDGDPTNNLDTDGDGTPDYLDTDDDGDMIATINEDSSGEQNPRNSANAVVDNNGIDTFRYLYNGADDVDVPNMQSSENEFRRSIEAIFFITNFSLETISVTELNFGTLSYDITIQSAE
jgi:hypothetical protein